MYFASDPEKQHVLDALNRSYHKLMVGAPLDRKIYWENRRQAAVAALLSGEDRIRTCGTQEVTK
jgi:hypothetical protein